MTLVAEPVFDVLDMEQRSPEWFRARLGMLTGSQAYAILAQGRARHEESVMRRNLRIRLALERVTGQWIPDTEKMTPAIQAGIDREPLARAAYEASSGELIQTCGYLQHRTHMAGCSPDGYIGTFDVIVSIKCRQPSAHYEFLRAGTIPLDALAQARHELWIVGADALDYVCFNPDFPPPLQLRTVRLTRELADIASYEAEALKFLGEVDREVEQLHEMAGGGW